jgi:hypothetical protein
MRVVASSMHRMRCMLQAIELEVTNEAKEHAAQYEPGLPSE